MEVMVVYFGFPGEEYPQITVKAELRAKKLCLWVQTCVICFYQNDHFFFPQRFSFIAISALKFVCYFSEITFGILELTEPYSKMVVRIVVMERVTRAGTAERWIQKQHQLRITSTTAGI